MSTLEDTATTTSKRADQVLTGQANWIRWFPGFKADARVDDTWVHFDGTEAILTKPVRVTYISNPCTNTDVEAQEKMTGAAFARQNLVYEQSVEEYKMNLYKYERQNERVRRANKMLYDRVDQSMSQDILDMASPKAALDHLQSLYKMQDSRAIQHAYNQISIVTLQGCASMTQYLETLCQLKSDLALFGETYAEAQLINKIVNGLPPAYSSWVDRFHDIMSDPHATKPSIKSIEAQLLAKEITIPKPSKGRDGNKGKRTEKKEKPTKAHGTIRDKCTYEPCGKWGHKEGDCFMKDPSKRDQKE